MSAPQFCGSTMRLITIALSAAVAALPEAAASLSYSDPVQVVRMQEGPCFIQQHYSSLLHSGEVLHRSAAGAVNSVGVGSASVQSEQAKSTQSTQVLPVGEKLRQAAGNESWATIWVHRLELRVPKPISALHKSKQGPIWKFAKTLKDQLCEAASLGKNRLNMLDVHTQGLNITLSKVANDTKKPGFHKLLNDKSQSDGKETVFNFEISPRVSDMETPASLAFELWRRELAAGNGSLGKGVLGEFLKKATIIQAGHQPAPRSNSARQKASVSLLTTPWLFSASLLAAGCLWLPAGSM